MSSSSLEVRNYFSMIKKALRLRSMTLFSSLRPFITSLVIQIMMFISTDLILQSSCGMSILSTNSYWIIYIQQIKWKQNSYLFDIQNNMVQICRTTCGLSVIHLIFTTSVRFGLEFVAYYVCNPWCDCSQFGMLIYQNHLLDWHDFEAALMRRLHISLFCTYIVFRHVFVT